MFITEPPDLFPDKNSDSGAGYKQSLTDTFMRDPKILTVVRIY